MKKIICLLFFLLCTSVSCRAEQVKFIQVTDVHLTKNNAIYLKQFVNDVNKQYNDLDFVVFTGDNIDKPDKADLELFLNIVKDLKFRTYVLAGNHDLFKSREMSKENYMAFVRKKLGRYHSDKPDYVFKKGIAFIALCGVKEVIPSPNGYFRNKELSWLDKTLEKYKNKKVVILQHFPLLDTDIQNHNLYQKEEYEKILARHNNVIAIISGHYHTNTEEKSNGIYHIITKNFSDNTYYKLIEIDDDMVYTMLINNGN